MRLSHLHFPYVLSIWGSDVYIFPFKSALHKHMLIGNVQAATAVASTSSKMAEQLKKIYECKKRIFITPFGVNTEQFSPSVNPKSSEKFIVGIVKLIEKVYGIEYLASSMSHLGQTTS
jgi:hypothetical protein